MNAPDAPRNPGERPDEPFDAAPDDPVERAGWERMTGELRAWANEPVAGPPLDMAALAASIEAEKSLEAAAGFSSPAAPGRRRWSPPALAWNLAAAALLLLAFSQTSFTLRIGDSRWQWGRQSADARPVAQANPPAAALDDHEAWLADLADQNQQLAKAVAQSHEQLAAWQKTESTTRYDDVARLIAMVQRQGALLNDRLLTLANDEIKPVRDNRGQ